MVSTEQIEIGARLSGCSDLVIHYPHLDSVARNMVPLPLGSDPWRNAGLATGKAHGTGTRIADSVRAADAIGSPVPLFNSLKLSKANDELLPPSKTALIEDWTDIGKQS